MRAILYIGGGIDKSGIYEKPEKGDLVIAADSGWHNAVALGASPTLLVGDFDSIGLSEPPEGVELYQVPAEKDDTDTALAVSLAISRGATELVLIGGLSGRLDHTLSNLGLLEMLWERRVHAVMTDGRNRVRYLKSSGTILARSDFSYFGVLAVSPTVKGVTLDGCKYPLKNAKLLRERQFAVSNEIVGNCALIEVRKGSVYVIESKDKT